MVVVVVVLFCRARQNIEHFGGIMVEHVQIRVLVACFALLNLAQIAEEMLRRIVTGVRTGKSCHCRSLARLHENCDIDRRMVERSSVLQTLSAHRVDWHSLPLDLNSNCRDSSLHVQCESSNIQFLAFCNKCNYCLRR